MEMLWLEGKGYGWFEKRRRTKGLELAHDQIIKAFDTVILLNKAAKSFLENNKKEVNKYLKNLYNAEKEVDRLRTIVFTELSKGAALIADYREDLLHLVKRLDTLADHTKDAARCLEMLYETEIPEELVLKMVFMTSKLVETAQILRESIEKIMADPKTAIKRAKKVEELESELDKEYLNAKMLFIKHGNEMNPGALIIFDDLIEFLEHAADMCADTADYIIVLSNRE
jgi:predicted phosphate transport protein (TIGR00153 family)